MGVEGHVGDIFSELFFICSMYTHIYDSLVGQIQFIYLFIFSHM